ncbi:MAG: hypothetical protein ABIA21_01190 [Candidatus Aenigmatarchaeota archaeon]
MTIGEELKKKMKVKLLATAKDGIKTPGGNIAFKDVVDIAKSREGGTLKARVKMVLGTCLSGGVTVDEKDPRQLQKEIDDGQVELK